MCQTVPKCWVIHAENRQDPPCFVRRSKTTLPAHEFAYHARQPIPRICTDVDNSSLFDTYSQNDTANKARRNSAWAPKRHTSVGQEASPTAAPSAHSDGRDVYGLRSAQTGAQRPTPGYAGIRYARFSERPSLTILGIATLPYGEYCNHSSNIDHLNLQTEKGLSAGTTNVISLLLRQRLIRQNISCLPNIYFGSAIRCDCFISDVLLSHPQYDGNTAFFSNFSLADSMPESGCWLFLWNFKKQGINHFLIIQPSYMALL